MTFSLRRRTSSGSRSRSERGVAAVEAGLITMFLSPLLAGVLWFGNHFWQQQKMFDPRVTQSAVVGSFSTCQDLLAAVKGTVLTNANNVSTGVPVGLDDITAQVVDFVPGQIGVDVWVSVKSPVAQSAVSWLLPNDGQLVSEALTRLENVRLTVQSCP